MGKRNKKKPSTTEKVLLITAIINLISTMLNFLNK